MSAEKLSERDAVLAEVIARIKLKRRSRKGSRFAHLVTSILSQQLSTKAADTIIGRFIALFPGRDFPGPKDVLKMNPAKMRGAGLSRAKVLYVKDLARHAERGTIDLENIHKLSDEEIIAELMKVNGIGRWTAEMFLIFSLRRPDVFSAGDLGLRNAIQIIYKLRKHPTEKQLKKISDKWRPHRSLACLYLWASLDNK